MRVLWLTENYPPRRGGMAQACDRIVGNLRQGGLTVDVAYFTPAGHTFKTIQQQNGRLLLLPVSDSPGHTLNCLYNYLSDPAIKTEYTHIVAFGGYMPILALPVFKSWLKTTAILLLRGNDFDLGIFMPQRRTMLVDALGSATAVCVLSKELEQKISLLFPKTTIKVIANGIDCANWHCEDCDYQAAETWRKQNATDNRLNIGIIGQLKEKKGVIFFLENVIRANLHDKFRFLLIGDVEQQVQDWLSARTENLAIVQLPFLDRFELLSWYPACDYIALPSHYDGMPNVLLEAGALGTPIIAARVGGIHEVMPDEQHKLTFHPGSADACREAIWQAANLSEKERQQIGASLKKQIEKHYSAADETVKYLKVFADLKRKKTSKKGVKI